MKTANSFATLRAGAAAVAVITLLASSPAFAQGKPAADEEASEADTIVVTGSLLRRTTTETALPLTVITDETLDRAGITNMADAIRQASADGAGSIGLGFTSGFS